MPFAKLYLYMKSTILGFLLIIFSTSAVLAVEKKEIDAIFKAKCMDCHSNETVMPWYATLPIVKDIIGADIEKGKSYFMLPSEFFAYQDLQSIPKHVVKRLQNEISHDTMPPILYKFGHFDKIVSADEKKKILEFARTFGLRDEDLETRGYAKLMMAHK